VVSPEEPDGTELQLALNDNAAAKVYQRAIFQQGQPAAVFYTDDVKGDYERIKARKRVPDDDRGRLRRSCFEGSLEARGLGERRRCATRLRRGP
jgi:hypothetical protein